ncbi:MAG: (2Fe-2S)-binding protein [Synergistales bacterium]|nr:(2Fe-2S)-binding protein [Synergistales bacterium]
MEGRFTINGQEHSILFPPGATLLDVLRGEGFTDVHEGCREGVCGACAVVLDGRLVNSCQVLAASARGREILTAGGLGTPASPHPIQQAFVDAGAVQCGFCTPGMVLAAWCLLRENPAPTEEEIKSALDGNLCRCTGYKHILEAVQLAAERMNTDD